ncbi:MAG: hypothetical protein M3R07_07385, partial [Gemmatimonadota bacterium]|nr:hypothetical protein [Gemmatimonadota bacterium]
MSSDDLWESGSLIPPPGSRDRAFATVVVCSSIVAIGIAAVYWLSRTGFANPPRPILRTTGFSLFLISAPHIARRVIARRNDEISWASSYSFLWLAALLLTAVAGRIGGPGSSVLSVLLATVGAAAFAAILVGWLKGSSIRRSIALIAGSGVFAVWTSGVVWGRIYKNPLFLENLAANGMVHHDSLHLAAFANMLRTYGVAGTGLDGLPY